MKSRWLLPLAVVLVAILAPSEAMPRASSSGTWTWSSSDQTLVTITLALDSGFCEGIVAIEGQGVAIEGVTGPVTVKSTTPLPRTGFVAVQANPPVGPGGTLRFAIKMSPALAADTVLSVQAYPTCGSGAGLQQINVTHAATTPPPTTTTNPTPVTPKPCTCSAINVKLDPTLLNKKGLHPDKHDFGVGFVWTMKCTKGQGGCTATLKFSPPVILAGTLPKPPSNLHLNISKLTFLCQADCGQGKSGKFQVKMLSRGQLNQLFGRTLAYTITTTCHGITKTTRVRVFVDDHGVLKAHP